MAIATAEKKASPKTVPKAVSKPIEVSGASQPAKNDSSFAIIETGGKQYTVQVGDIIKIEKLARTPEQGGIKVNFKEGDSVTFDKVLLIGGTIINIGTPYITGATVSGIITEIGRSKKVTVIHYKQKSRYFKKAGHRQPFFKVKIEKI